MRNTCFACGESGTMMYVLHGRRYHYGCDPIDGNNPISGMISYVTGLLNNVKNIIKMPFSSYSEQPEPSEESKRLAKAFGPELKIVKSKSKSRL